MNEDLKIIIEKIESVDNQIVIPLLAKLLKDTYGLEESIETLDEIQSEIDNKIRQNAVDDLRRL